MERKNSLIRMNLFTTLKTVSMLRLYWVYHYSYEYMYTGNSAHLSPAMSLFQVRAWASRLGHKCSHDGWPWHCNFRPLAAQSKACEKRVQMFPSLSLRPNACWSENFRPKLAPQRLSKVCPIACPLSLSRAGLWSWSGVCWRKLAQSFCPKLARKPARSF